MWGSDEGKKGVPGRQAYLDLEYNTLNAQIFIRLRGIKSVQSP